MEWTEFNQEIRKLLFNTYSSEVEHIIGNKVHMEYIRECFFKGKSPNETLLDYEQEKRKGGLKDDGMVRIA